MLAIFTGIVLGLVVAFAMRLIQGKKAREIAEELFRESEAARGSSVDALVETMKASFGSLSLEVLSKSTEEFLKLADARLKTEREAGIKDLDAKKGLIDQQLARMNAELESVSTLVRALERDRVEKFGELASRLKTAGEQSNALLKTTNMLREALVSTRARGQWGERMAEDVLRVAGFIEEVNYVKQKKIQGAGSRPDFTFLLPRGYKLNMDVKFPLDNYVRHLEAGSEMEKERYLDRFLGDVKARIKEVTTRDYINPEQNTVDYVLLFIPNEKLYALIHDRDSRILDDGLKNRVVFCSPLTLFAVLAVIRQAVDNFALEQTSSQILSLLGNFKKQWGEFVKKLETLGKRIEDTQKEYESLTTTRRRQLERPLNKIDDLRKQRRLPASPDEPVDLPADERDPEASGEDP